MPLVAQLKQAGLSLDVETANLEVLKWLRDVANARMHQSTRAVPLERWQEEKDKLQPLPRSAPVTSRVIASSAHPKLHRFEPVELQHPLSVYEAMLQEVAR